MHAEAYAYISRWATDDAVGIIEFGSRETWGPRIRDLFPNARYCGLDAVDGPGVDRVENCAKPIDAGMTVTVWGGLVDVVICAEVFEHTPLWRDIVLNAFICLRPGGRAIFTCAGPGRPVHGVGTDNPDDPTWYANVAPAELHAAMRAAGFTQVAVEAGPNVHGGGGHDTYGTGVRP